MNLDTFKKEKRVYCPECGTMIYVIDGKLATHGPGKNSLSCNGSGNLV